MLSFAFHFLPLRLIWLDSWTVIYKHLAPLKSGPYASSVAFLTLFKRAALLSSERYFGYGAQEAELGLRRELGTVKVIAEVQLTDTCGAVLPNPTGRTSRTPWTTYLGRGIFGETSGFKSSAIARSCRHLYTQVNQTTFVRRHSVKSA